MKSKEKRKALKQGKASLKRIEKIKLKGGATTWADKQFLKTIRHAKGSNLSYEKMVIEKSGPCEIYIDESLIKKR